MDVKLAPVWLDVRGERQLDPGGLDAGQWHASKGYGTPEGVPGSAQLLLHSNSYIWQ